MSKITINIFSELFYVCAEDFRALLSETCVDAHGPVFQPCSADTRADACFYVLDDKVVNLGKFFGF